MTERTVSQSMSQGHLASLGPNATALEAACLMTKVGCSSVLVMDGPGALQGIVTERDLMTRVVAKGMHPENTLLRDIMTHNPYCVGPDMLVSDAVVMMVEHGFRHLPIMSANHKVMGVISVRDASPGELGEAFSLAEFHQQVNDALG